MTNRIYSRGQHGCIGSYGNLSGRDGAELSERMRCKESVLSMFVYCIDQQYRNCYVMVLSKYKTLITCHPYDDMV